VMHPLITIGITCYNASETIVRAIVTAERQTYPNTEILIVDDASEDTSCLLIRKYIKDKPHIRLIKHEENKGFPSALNTLLEQANGEYISFFDDDDESDIRRLELQLERLQMFSMKVQTDQVLCYTNRWVVLPDTIEPDHMAYAIGREEPEPYGPMVADYILWHTHERLRTWGLFGSCTLLSKTSFLRDLGGFDVRFRRSAEMDMAVRASQIGAYFIAVNAPLVTQYKTPTSDKSGNIPLKYALLLCEKHKAYLKSKGVFLSAKLIARHKFAVSNNHNIMMYVWLVAAALLNPRKILWEKLTYKLKQ